MPRALPTHQGLERDRGSARQIDDRLIVKPKLAVGQSCSDGRLQRVAGRERILIGNDLILTGAFGFVERLVGATQQDRGLDQLAVGIPGGRTHRDGDSPVRRLPDRDAADGFDESLADGDRAEVIGSWKDDRKFLAAVSGDEVPFTTERRSEGAGHGDQRLVADEMTEAVVELLETVNVDHDQRQRLPGAGRPAPLPPQRLIERAAVGHAGQRVADAHAKQLLLHGLLGRDVEQKAHHAM